MEIRILKYFLAVVREENITKAAESLHITQPTLSRQLMQLEDELQCQLFIRGKNKVTLTHEGMLLRRRAEEIVDLTLKTEKEFLSQANQVAGEIFIGSGESYAFHMFAKKLYQFQRQYPHVQYHIESGNADDIKQKIDQGLIDIGLLMEPVDVDKYDCIHLDYQERWGIIARKDCELAKKGYVTPKDIVSLPLIVPHRLLVQNELGHWLNEDFSRLNIVATHNLVFNAAIMVEEGLGYVISIDGLINTDEHSVLCFLPFQPEMKTGNVLVYKKQQVFSPATTKFIEFLKG